MTASMPHPLLPPTQGDDPAIQALAAMRLRLARTDGRSTLLNMPRRPVRGSALPLLPGPVAPLVGRLLGDRDGLELRAVGPEPGPASPPLALDFEGYADLPRLLCPGAPKATRSAIDRLARTARETEEQTGANLLALALGALTWVGEATPSKPRMAPVLLVPTRLVLSTGDGRWFLHAGDGELLTNMSLAELLRDTFHGEAAVLGDADRGHGDPEAVFEALEGLCAQRPGWSLNRDHRRLALFSHANDLLARDLGTAAIRAEATRLDAPMRRCLTRQVASGVTPLSPHADDAAAAFDLDSGQTQAVAAALVGHNLVVAGPPGTGKSQTIAAIIAGAAAAGKTVLFMAQKTVALDIVRDKLDQAGLSERLLDLHGDGASLRAVHDRIRRSRQPAAAPDPQAPPAESADDPAALFTRLADALHGPGPSGSDVSPWQALAELVDAAGAGWAAPRTDLSALAGLSAGEEARLQSTLGRFADAVSAFGPRAAHPWAGTTRRDLLPTDIARLREPLTRIGTDLRDLTALRQGLEPPLSAGVDDGWPLEQVIRVQREARALSPALAGALWLRRDDREVSQHLEAIAQWQQDATQRATWLAPGAERQDSSALRSPLGRGTRAPLPSLSRQFRAASDSLAGLLAAPLPARARDRYARLLDLLATQAHHRTVAGHDSALVDLLGPAWPGAETGDAARCLDALAGLRRLAVGTTAFGDAAVASILALSDAQVARIARFDAAAQTLGRTLTPVLENLGWSAPTDTGDILETAERLEQLARHLGEYEDWLALTAEDATLEAAGLAPVMALIEAERLDSAAAMREYRHALAEARWRDAVGRLPALADLRACDRHDLVARWHRVEARRRARALAALSGIGAAPAAAVPDTDPGWQLLAREIGRKSGHLTLRQLLLGAGATVQRLYPVILATPYTVGRFIAPEAMRFDLMVIDEASQMRPEFALGGMARAGQVIVCGDDKQLPPGDFFERVTGPCDSASTPRDLPPEAVEPAEMESILTLAQATGFERRMLETHYRSRAAALIATSNRLFYDDRLVVPPSPRDGQADHGLILEPVAGLYQRGDDAAGTNGIEARAIAAAIADHARRNPEMSLGVATFSVAQRDMVRHQIERARRADPVLDRWITAHDDSAQSAMFVKNLEDVQGDERDVVLISIGYGPDRAGGRLASQNFGPVNRAGGERRLNTLFTRARNQCRVFCSFDPDDIDPTSSRHAGPMVLKRFLDAAASGPGPEFRPHDPGTDRIRSDIARALAALGVPCAVGIGPAAYRIDVAVAARHDPQGTGLAVLLDTPDGRGNHSDADLVLRRERVLRERGWRIHQIWGADWYHRHGREIRRLAAALADPL